MNFLSVVKFVKSSFRTICQNKCVWNYLSVCVGGRRAKKRQKSSSKNNIRALFSFFNKDILLRCIRGSRDKLLRRCRCLLSAPETSHNAPGRCRSTLTFANPSRLLWQCQRNQMICVLPCTSSIMNTFKSLKQILISVNIYLLTKLGAKLFQKNGSCVHFHFTPTDVWCFILRCSHVLPCLHLVWLYALLEDQ